MAHQVVQNILMFQKLSEYTPEQISKVLHGESAQTIAVVLSRLKPELSKEVLKFFLSDEQKEIMFKMGSAANVAPEVISGIANSLAEKLRVFDEGTKVHEIGGNSKMAEILKHMGPGKGQELLDAMSKKDSGMADHIKQQMFLFKDILNAEESGLQKALMDVKTETLALALKGESKEMMVKVIQSLSANRGKMLVGDIKSMGPQKRSDVDAAKTDVLSQLRKFYDQGILRLKEDQSSDEWV